jgi:hypothetical protein
MQRGDWINRTILSSTMAWALPRPGLWRPEL